MEGRIFFGVGDVLGTSGEGSTVIGISGMLSSGRALGLEAGVDVAAGNGGSWPVARVAQKNVVNAKTRNFINPIGKVGVTGFEPATSWSQTTRSTKLSYTPG